MNHTSDQHPWFQESRRDPDRPVRRLLRVERHRPAVPGRPDHLRRHRGVQLDLRPGAPAVLLAPVLLPPAGPQLRQPGGAARRCSNVIRFWLDLGIDGFRLDAVPYLFEREGTNCENLPETHAFLKRCRKMIDDEYPGRVLLAEANQWPTDVVAYFGDPAIGGDECHMAFHFPLMPRIFMAVRRESRLPISEIMAQTPRRSRENCQWGIFLRNHDELTLEMVTDEERDYMYAEYAKDPRMRANVGIRRRLAPLLDNDRDQIELFTALLLSLPGSPVLYYGDEIGMGDNIWLGDRDGGADPDAVDAGPQRRLLRRRPGPAVPAGQPGRRSTATRRSTSRPSGTTPPTLLNWTRRMLAIRKPARGVRGRHVPGPGWLQPVGAGVSPAGRRRRGAVREQPVPLPAADRAEPAGLGRLHPGGADRTGHLPTRRASAVPAHPARPQLLLVPAQAT